jgi:hypothetical protein
LLNNVQNKNVIHDLNTYLVRTGNLFRRLFRLSKDVIKLSAFFLHSLGPLAHTIQLPFRLINLALQTLIILNNTKLKKKEKKIFLGFLLLMCVSCVLISIFTPHVLFLLIGLTLLFEGVRLTLRIFKLQDARNELRALKVQTEEQIHQQIKHSFFALKVLYHQLISSKDNKYSHHRLCLQDKFDKALLEHCNLVIHTHKRLPLFKKRYYYCLASVILINLRASNALIGLILMTIHPETLIFFLITTLLIDMLDTFRTFFYKTVQDKQMVLMEKSKLAIIEQLKDDSKECKSYSAIIQSLPKGSLKKHRSSSSFKKGSYLRSINLKPIEHNTFKNTSHLTQQTTDNRELLDIRGNFIAN